MPVVVVGIVSWGAHLQLASSVAVLSSITSFNALPAPIFDAPPDPWSWPAERPPPVPAEALTGDFDASNRCSTRLYRIQMPTITRAPRLSLSAFWTWPRHRDQVPAANLAFSIQTITKICGEKLVLHFASRDAHWHWRRRTTLASNDHVTAPQCGGCLRIAFGDPLLALPHMIKHPLSSSLPTSGITYSTIAKVINVSGWSTAPVHTMLHVSARDNFKLLGYLQKTSELRASSSLMTRPEAGIPTYVKQTFALARFVGGATNHRIHEGPGTGTTGDWVWGC
ncbi:hypothetical protein EDB85DRAFT_1888685 [Lactarius pseudohatsudake]|nr:hypothetical protein EDB85DRAFT_1888685 [Lactarius pseudohatsudake]